MSEIILKLGLKDEKFARGLATNETRFKDFVRRVEQIRQTNQGGGVLPPLPEVAQKADGILGLLRRKFGTADLFKDSLRSLGVGLGVGAIAERVVSFFSRGAERAKAMADHSEAMVDIQRTLAGALGGPRRELELQVKHVNELNRDIEAQKKLVESLRNTPLEILSPGHAEQLDAAEDKLNSLQHKQAQLGAGAKAAAHAENLRTAALQRQLIHSRNLAEIELKHGVDGQKFEERKRALLEERVALQKQGALPSALQENANQQSALEQERKIFFRNMAERMEDLKAAARLEAELSKAQLRDAGEVEKKQIRLNALRRDYDVIKKRSGINSPELEANRNQQRALIGEISVDRRNAGRERRETLAELGSSLETGRGTTPRSRGRSERERIADRGASYRMQAEEAMRTGKSPEYVARLTKMATRDTEKAGKSAANALKQIDKNDPAVGQLIRISKTLDNIDKNLAPKGTK